MGSPPNTPSLTGMQPKVKKVRNVITLGPEDDRKSHQTIGGHISFCPQWSIYFAPKRVRETQPCVCSGDSSPKGPSPQGTQGKELPSEQEMSFKPECHELLSHTLGMFMKVKGCSSELVKGYHPQFISN